MHSLCSRATANPGDSANDPPNPGGSLRKGHIRRLTSVNGIQVLARDSQRFTVLVVSKHCATLVLILAQNVATANHSAGL